jgi:ABC-type phosphate/phosphonate transport system substrate-binding protein
MQAALPMYFPPREALQAFWAVLAGLLRQAPEARGIDIPELLSQPADCHVQWLEGDLLLSQACGYPLVTQLAGKVQLVGSLAYDAPGVQGIYCQSQLICRVHDKRTTLADFAGSTLAFNDTLSQSGYNALRALVASTTNAPRPFFASSLQTGAHYRSINSVRQGQADMAALDPVSWALWQQSHPALATELKVFGQTEKYPGLPLITARQTPPALVGALRCALQTICTEAAYTAVRAPLLIGGFETTRLSDYERCLDLQNQAFAQGLRQL